MIYQRNPGPLRILRREFFRVRKRSALKILIRSKTGYEGVLPTFMIIGAARCGTTSLYNYLAQNPALSPSLVKEIRYFDVHYRRGLAWYKAHFAAQRHDQPPTTFEGTPYMFFPHVERRVSLTLPDARFIVLLRDPVERAYSHHKLLIKFGLEHRSFEQVIEDEPEILATDLKKMEDDEFYVSNRVMWAGHIAKGIYVDQLMRWEQYFPRERFLILRSEDFYADPGAALRQVADFVGFPYHEPRDYHRFLPTSGPSMDPATRQRLVDFYREHNARLYDYLGRDLGWDR